ncbi:MAG: mechanosensitive ion channel family protein [Gammaproteobacteria bacterium]|nr:mechanosensitive ion channel family protein [Gammaproteobacteria bacterium]
MPELDNVAEVLLRFWLATLTILIFGAAIWLNNRLLSSKDAARTGLKFRRQLISFLMVNAGLVVFLVALPLAEELRGQLLALVGIVVSAALALSSTTLLGNMMAGAMLRLIKSYRVGDFLKVEDQFGRVSEIGLLHTEIQTEDRDLVTLPNLYLINNSYRVLRTSGTIVSATCSIGYDTHHAEVEKRLLEAAQQAGLQEPFVHVLELGNFSVTYRLAGLLTEIKQLLSTRSRLHVAMLDALHEVGIEIMSPVFQAQRPVVQDAQMIPNPQRGVSKVAQPAVRPEEIAFDKAEAAVAREELNVEHAALLKYIEELQSQLKETADDAARSVLERRIQHADARAGHLLARVEQTAVGGA